MKHLFASGEVIYFKNKKELEQGTLVAEFMEYDTVDVNSIFKAIGEIDGKVVSVNFSVKKDSFEDIKFRHSIKILMQSDLLLADWEDYEVEYL